MGELAHHAQPSSHRTLSTINRVAELGAPAVLVVVCVIVRPSLVFLLVLRTS